MVPRITKMSMPTRNLHARACTFGHAAVKARNVPQIMTSPGFKPGGNRCANRVVTSVLDHGQNMHSYSCPCMPIPVLAPSTRFSPGLYTVYKPGGTRQCHLTPVSNRVVGFLRLYYLRLSMQAEMKQVRWCNGGSQRTPQPVLYPVAYEGNQGNPSIFLDFTVLRSSLLLSVVAR